MWASNNASSAFVGGTVRDSESALQSIGQYIEDYLDLVENVPNEIVRSITQLHEKSHMYHKLVEKLERTLAKVTSDPQSSDSRNEPGQSGDSSNNGQSGDSSNNGQSGDSSNNGQSGDSSNSGQSSNNGQSSNSGQSKGSEPSAQDVERRRKQFEVIQRYLVAIQSISDEKLYIVQSIYEQLELKARQLDHDLRTISLGSGNTSLISPMKSPRDVRGYYNSFNDRHPHMNGNGNNNGNNGSIASESSPENNSSEENGSQDAVSDNGHENGSGRRVGGHENGSGRRVGGGESRVSHTAKNNGTTSGNHKNNGTTSSNHKNNGTTSSNHIDHDDDENDADSESPAKERKRSRRTKNSRGRDEDGRDGHNRSDHSTGHNRSDHSTGHNRSDHSTGRGGKKRGFSGKSKDHNISVSSQQHNTSSTHHSISKKSRKRETGNDSPNFLDDVDPDEPTYCLCNQISYGEMIGCDNTNCQIEWFHFSCVQLSTKPKGKWFCPACRGDRSNIQRK